jgi:hypothetical protein
MNEITVEQAAPQIDGIMEPYVVGKSTRVGRVAYDTCARINFHIAIIQVSC